AEAVAGQGKLQRNGPGKFQRANDLAVDRQRRGPAGAELVHERQLAVLGPLLEVHLQDHLARGHVHVRSDFGFVNAAEVLSGVEFDTRPDWAEPAEAAALREQNACGALFGNDGFGRDAEGTIERIDRGPVGDLVATGQVDKLTARRGARPWIEQARMAPAVERQYVKLAGLVPPQVLHLL